MMYKEINDCVAKYESLCIDKPPRKATTQEYNDMLKKSEKWSCSYT